MDKEEFDLTGYKLSRIWFDWCFENPEKISTNHTALYFFIIEHCNRMGWKEKFGLPSGMAKDAIGIKSYKTYIKTLNDLIDFGFIKMVQKSTNQYSSNIVALVKNTKAHTKALDKAMLKHMPKQVQSISTINKPITYKPGTDKLLPTESAAHWKKFIEKFENWYSGKFDTKYNYLQKDFGCLKKIHKFFERRAEEKKVEFTEAWLLDAFDWFLEKAWNKDQWLKNNFSIPNLLSQFNQIANSNGSHKQNNSGNKTAVAKSTGAQQLLSSLKADLGIS